MDVQAPLQKWGGEMRDWIDGGHTYRIGPYAGLVGTIIGVLVVLILIFGGAAALGASQNSSAAAFALAAVVVALPLAGIAVLVVFLRRAGLFIDAKWVWRKSIFGNDAGGCERSQVTAVAVHKGSYAGWVAAEPEPEDNVLWLALRNGGRAMPTKMYFYTIRQAQLLAAVLGVPFEMR